MEMTAQTTRAVIMFDCCHWISAQAAFVTLFLNPVSMVINWGLIVFTLEQQQCGCRNALIAFIATALHTCLINWVGK